MFTQRILIFVLVAITGSNVASAQAKPENLQSLLARALELEKAKNYAAAETIYRQAALNSVDDPEILMRLGIVCQRQRKYEESIQVLQKILVRAPLYPGVNSLLAVSYYELNRFDKTIEATQKELIGDPKNREARYYQSLALSASGRLYEAIQHLEMLLKEDPQNLPVAYQLAVDYKAAAQQSSQRLARIAPDSEFTHALRAEGLADAERFNDAVAEFNEVLRKNPNFPGIHLALGQTHWRQKELDKARQELKLALLEEANQPLASYYLADILTTDKEYAQAIPLLELTVSVYPHLSRAFWLLGKCCAATGNHQRALEAYQKALLLNPNYKEVHFQLYELYARLGNKAESQQHQQIFEKLNRDDQNKDRETFQESARKRKESENNP